MKFSTPNAFPAPILYPAPFFFGCQVKGAHKGVSGGAKRRCQGWLVGASAAQLLSPLLPKGCSGYSRVLRQPRQPYSPYAKLAQSEPAGRGTDEEEGVGT